MDNEYFASINDVSKQLNVPAHTLRYWEKQFPVAIRPTTGNGGRRYYRAETVRCLMVIRDMLYKHGMTIAGVKKLLRDGKLPDTADDFMADGTAVQKSAVTASQKNTDIINAAITMLEQAKNILA